MSLSFKMKVLLQDLKKCKHWFSYCPKTVLNDYTKEICAKQVATKNDFLMAFLHLEPLLNTGTSLKLAIFDRGLRSKLHLNVWKNSHRLTLREMLRPF